MGSGGVCVPYTGGGGGSCGKEGEPVCTGDSLIGASTIALLRGIATVYVVLVESRAVKVSNNFCHLQLSAIHRPIVADAFQAHLHVSSRFGLSYACVRLYWHATRFIRTPLQRESCLVKE